MSKLCFLDVETTSRNTWKGAITEIAAIIEQPGKEQTTFHKKLRPHADAFIEDEALTVQGITRFDLDAPDREIPAIAFADWLAFLKTAVDPYSKTDKLILIAHNAKFDTDFIESWFRLNNNRFFGAYFHRPSICTYILSIYNLKDTWHMLDDHKQHTLFDSLGLDIREERHLHSAMYDVKMCQALYHYFARKNKV